eukprot:CAMPEP_0181124934 /NCGR_PEP_ID=MMETSP1071-20121207/26769_1 /TAXON_ID=35127 /ORGANISM="Thalassiosira sp., Strain NH16" /LENGTH=569 /DNA_ID=CAMNT_0023210319 /DNA_START=194 /DNA_END=1903 /DNA_ORIENTATION=-
MMKRLGRQKKEGDDETTVLTVVNGDVLGGSSLLVNCQGSAAIEVMNSIPVDLAVLGNHEFDYGDKALMERVKESNFVWLGSNVYHPGIPSDSSDMPVQESFEPESQVGSVQHYFPGVHGNGKIYELSNDLKLGVFGLVTKLTPKISNPSENVIFDDEILSVARRIAKSLRARGARVIVAITHMSEAEDRLLAADRSVGVDLILGGHEHEPFSTMVHRNEDTAGDNGIDEIDAAEEVDKHNEGGVLVFKCGMNAYWVGSVDLDIIQENQNITSISTTWSMQAVTSRTPEDPAISEIVKSCRKKTDDSAMMASFGKDIASAISLDDAIATIGETGGLGENSNNATSAAGMLPLDTRMSSVRRREATGGNLVADAMHWMLKENIRTENKNGSSPLPMLAMINGGFIRGDRLYKPGSIITVREILKELPFQRTMKVLEIEGFHLKNAMVQQLKGSAKGPTGAYPHLSSNARFAYALGDSSSADNGSDLGGNDHYRIISFEVDGRKIVDDQKYLVAVTCFVADGGEGCISWLKSTRIQNMAWEGVNMACVLFKYLQRHPAIRPVLEDRVRLQTR